MKATLTAALVLIGSPALGAYFDGNALNDLCRSDKRSAAYYVMGATDQITDFCAPNGVAFTQIVDVVCNYLGDHPETRQSIAAGLTRTAVSEAWPCQ